MAHLQHKTRNNIYPHGLPKVYFCCTAEDQARYFDKIAAQLLKLQNCSIWYKTADVSNAMLQEHLDALAQMQLFVMPVTKNLLTKPNQALDTEFRFAIEHHIPVLPLMQEPNLAALFNRKCGNIQFLDETAEDATALAYMDKLEKYLNSVLTADTLTRQVRNAFDAYIFMSYRKKDRKYAQQLMNMIHRNPRYRGLAIWYDEFLTPGENFNQTIFDALKKSVLFALTVTPNLLENGNYVMTQEYPEALREKKPVIPFEMSATDTAALKQLYHSIPACVDPHDQQALEQALGAQLKQIALGSDDSPEHAFLLGLAYLEGIDVETDHSYALKLIKAAAEQALPEAAEKLVSMYSKGQGVAQDIQKACYWQQKLVEMRQNTFHSAPSLQNGIALLTDLAASGDLLSQLGDLQGSANHYSQMLSYAQVLSKSYTSPRLTLLHSSALINAGDIFRGQEDYSQALSFYEESRGMLTDALAASGIKPVNGIISTVPGDITAQTVHLLSNFILCWFNTGDMYLRLAYERQSRQEMQAAEDALEKLKATLLSEAVKNRLPNYQRLLSMLYSRLGEITKCKGAYAEAKTYYKQALSLDRARLESALDAQDIDALDDYALSCYDMATVDPGRVDLPYLKDACAIWRWLKKKFPFMPIYADRLEDVEPMILQEDPWFSLDSLSIEQVLSEKPAAQQPKPAEEPKNDFYPSAEINARFLAKMKPFNSEEIGKHFIDPLLDHVASLEETENAEKPDTQEATGKYSAGKDGKPLKAASGHKQADPPEEACDLTADQIIAQTHAHAEEDDEMIAAAEAARKADERRLMHEEALAKAEHGDQNAMYKVFSNFLRGWGTSVSIEDAKYWAQRLFEQDKGTGYFCYYEIYDATNSPESARKMLKLAARKKNPSACLSLSRSYKYGYLFKKNQFLASYWDRRWKRERKKARRALRKKRRQPRRK